MNNDKDFPIEIRAIHNIIEAETCARLMASSEPWITLRRSYNVALQILTDSSKERYLATIDDEIVGFLILVMQGAFVGYIQTAFVAEAWRNQGIGRQLLAFAEARIFREAPNVFMCVSSFNRAAQRLYERLGYQVVGELKDYIVTGYSEVLLRKSIAPLAEFKRGPNPEQAPL